MPRIYCPTSLLTGAPLSLPSAAARHVQVLRLQPGDALTLFNGDSVSVGGEFNATITRMGRSDVEVIVGEHDLVEREAAVPVHLVLGMPANERMDWLVEKATELGVASIQPLMTERSVLRLTGERAEKKQLHWQSIAIAACEQCGRNRVPMVHPIMSLSAWLKANTAPAANGHPQQALQRLILSLQPGTQALQGMLKAEWAGQGHGANHDSALGFMVMSGPEGGLSPQEETSARVAGFLPVTLGVRTLRAETAALAALVVIASGVQAAVEPHIGTKL